MCAVRQLALIWKKVCPALMRRVFFFRIVNILGTHFWETVIICDFRVRLGSMRNAVKFLFPPIRGAVWLREVFPYIW
jgi:hypothetical protein